jgi:hypothetical protein
MSPSENRSAASANDIVDNAESVTGKVSSETGDPNVPESAVTVYVSARAEQKTNITSIHEHFFINTSFIPVPPFGAKLYHRLKQLSNAFDTISNKNNILFFITITCAIK